MKKFYWPMIVIMLSLALLFLALAKCHAAREEKVLHAIIVLDESGSMDDMRQEAIEAFKRWIDSHPASARLRVWLAAAYAQAGEIDEAEWEVDQIATLNPELSLQRIQEIFPLFGSADRKRFLEGLRKAGLSE